MVNNESFSILSEGTKTNDCLYANVGMCYMRMIGRLPVGARDGWWDRVVSESDWEEEEEEDSL